MILCLIVAFVLLLLFFLIVKAIEDNKFENYGQYIVPLVYLVAVFCCGAQFGIALELHQTFFPGMVSK